MGCGAIRRRITGRSLTETQHIKLAGNRGNQHPWPAGIAVSRTIGGSAYDLFVSHQVVFPLVPGAIAIPGAMLKYSTPLALQFFSQEERFALTSLPDTLVVRALPSAGRPADFNGAVGSGLRLERRINPPTAHAGEGVAVELVLTGEGNTALWPPPEIRWPRAARAYVSISS